MEDNGDIFAQWINLKKDLILGYPLKFFPIHSNF